MYEVWTRPGVQPLDIWLLVFVGYLIASGLVAIGMYFRILSDEKNDLEKQCQLLCNEYLDNMFAYLRWTKGLPVAFGYAEPDEGLMRCIEEAIGVPETGADDFRRKLSVVIHNHTHSLDSRFSHLNIPFNWYTDPVLAKAIRTVVLEHDHMERLGLLTS